MFDFGHFQQIRYFHQNDFGLKSLKYLINHLSDAGFENYVPSALKCRVAHMLTTPGYVFTVQ